MKNDGKPPGDDMSQATSLMYYGRSLSKGKWVGASQETGWTGIVARIMHLFATMNAEEYLQLGKWASADEARQKVTT